MAGHLIYHWKHGWIPLTHAAALSKAHGSAAVADKYVHGASTHHGGPRLATRGKSARQIHGGLAAHGSMPTRHTSPEAVKKLRAGDTATVTGLDAHGRTVTVHGTVTNDPGSTIARIKLGHAGDVKHHYEVHMKASGLDGQYDTKVYVETGHNESGAVPDVPKTPSTTATPTREHFRMSGPELKTAAAGGDAGAQAELDRRAAKRGGKAAGAAKKTAAPPAKTEPPKAPPTLPRPTAPAASDVASIEKDLRGHTITPEPPHPVFLPSDTQFDANGVRVGTVVDNRDGTFTAVYRPGRKQVGDKIGTYSSRREAHLALREHHDPAGSKPVPAAPPAVQAENKTIETALYGHTIKTNPDVRGRALDAQYDANGNRIGSVVHLSDGQFGASYDGQKIGTFATRKDAHVAIRQKHFRAEAGRKAGAAAPSARPTPTSTPSATADPTAGPSLESIQRVVGNGHTIKEFGGVGRVYDSQYDAKGEKIGNVVSRGDGKFHVLYKHGKSTKEITTYDSRVEAHVGLREHHKATVSGLIAKSEKAAKARDKRSAAIVKDMPAWEPHTLESDGTLSGAVAHAKIKQAYAFGPNKQHIVHIESDMQAEQTQALLNDIHATLLATGLEGPETKGIVFRVPTGDTNFRRKPRGITGAYVRVGQRAVHINPKVANGELNNVFGGEHGGHGMMPAAKDVTGRRYVLTHELGHVIDHEHNHTRDVPNYTPSGVRLPAGSPDASRTLYRQHARSGLSEYGRTNQHEAYAEAYAQWVNGGPGSSATADAYAHEFGWVTPKRFRHGRSA